MLHFVSLEPLNPWPLVPSGITPAQLEIPRLVRLKTTTNREMISNSYRMLRPLHDPFSLLCMNFLIPPRAGLRPDGCPKKFMILAQRGLCKSLIFGRLYWILLDCKGKCTLYAHGHEDQVSSGQGRHVTWSNEAPRRKRRGIKADYKPI